MVPHIDGMAAHTDSRVRLASYNIRKCVGTDRRRDPGRVLSVLAGLEADVVALQEADLRLGQRHAALDAEEIAEVTGLVPVAMDHSAVSLGWHGNAVLVAEGIEVEAVKALPLPGLEPRGALQVDLSRDGQALRLVAVHLGLRRRDRARQIAAILRALDALPPRPTVIAGDYNEWSPRKGLAGLEETFTVHAPGATFHARIPVAPLDRIALSDSLRLHEAGVVETELTRRASDHLPIWAEIVPA